MSINVAVHCSGVTKTYGAGESTVLALRGVDLDVQRGELLMLVGPSGCGKTTLLSIISGILTQNEGHCEVFGADMRSLSARQRAELRGRTIGFVFQAFNLLPALTALENVCVPLLLRRWSRKNAEARARQILEKVELGERANSRPAQLSGGQQQRIAIARALVHDPQLIVCDEPTSNLDHNTGRAMLQILRDRAKSPDRAIIVVTHDPRIFSFADRIARMDDGRVVDIVQGAGDARTS